MKKIVSAMALLIMLVSLSGCFYYSGHDHDDRDDRYDGGDGYDRGDRGERGGRY